MRLLAQSLLHSGRGRPHPSSCVCFSLNRLLHVFRVLQTFITSTDIKGDFLMWRSACHPQGRRKPARRSMQREGPTVLPRGWFPDLSSSSCAAPAVQRKRHPLFVPCGCISPSSGFRERTVLFPQTAQCWALPGGLSLISALLSHKELHGRFQFGTHA